MTAPPLAERLSFYPRYLFPHSLTFNEWARLTAKDIHEGLHRRRGFEGQDIWFYSNHPIKWVRVVGIVVAYDDMEKMVSITVDDGSGYLMDLIVWKGEPPIGKKPKFSLDDLKGVSLHSIIKAKGSLGEFRGNKQLLLRRIAVLCDTNDEVNAWTETVKFKKNVLSKPWHLTEEFISEEWRRMRESVEKEERKKEKQRRKDERMLREKEEELEKALRKKKGKRKAAEESARGSQFGTEDVVTEVSYRGHRRLLAPEKPEPLPPGRELPDHPTSHGEETPQPEASESVYRGRRRRSPRPWPPPVSPGLKPADGSTPILAEAGRLSKPQRLNTHCSERDGYDEQEPDYKRRRCYPTAGALGSGVRGCHWSPGTPLQLTVSNVALLERSTSSEIQAGNQPQPSVKPKPYVGRRRAGSESASIIQDLHGTHPPTKLETIPSSPPKVVNKSHSSRYSPRRPRIPHADVLRDKKPKADFPGLIPEQVPSGTESSTSIYRGRRRRTGSETASVVDSTIKRAKLEIVEPPPPPLSVLAECPTESHSYRGRRRRGEAATSSQISRESSIISNPVEEKSGYGRRPESTVPENSVLPPHSISRDGDGSSYRGRRRAQVS